MAKKITYQSAGVSIAANDALVKRIQTSIRKTSDRRVITNINGFVGFFSLLNGKRKYQDPILVGCTDGVGSKVLLAIAMKQIKTIGIDLVAMNVNDLVTGGAEPLFFLDYIALHKNNPRYTADIIEGVADGCVEAGCALLGGETAEMPAVYKKGDFDLAGFAVGVVEKKNLITGHRIKPGDVMIGLLSSGVHSNGYALARKLFFEIGGYKLSSRIKGWRCSLGQELLTPTRIYVRPILSLLKKSPGIIKGMAHITGGGLPGNVPRILPRGCQALVHKGSWPIPSIFTLMQSMGVSDQEMYRVFNMGVGMVLIVSSGDVVKTLAHFRRQGFPAQPIGRIQSGNSEFILSHSK